MTTESGQGSGIEDGKWMRFASKANSKGEVAPHRREPETNRKSYVLYWTIEPPRRRFEKIRSIIDWATYALIIGIVLYSVSMNSLAVLTPAIIITGLHIVLSRLYDERAKARRKIEQKNYRDLVSPQLSMN